MTASQIRLDFPKHILHTANVCFAYTLLQLQLLLYAATIVILAYLVAISMSRRDVLQYVLWLCEGIFCFYYTIGQLILHQQQKQWSNAKITQNRLMNDEVASI